MTVEKINDKEQNDLKDLKQQIESLSMIMKSATVGNVKPKRERSFLPKKERDVWEFSSERVSGVT